MKVYHKKRNRSIDDTTLLKIDNAIDTICDEISEKKCGSIENYKLVSSLAELLKARADIN